MSADLFSRFVRAAFLCSILCGSLSAVADVGSWSRIGPEGASLTDIKFHPADTQLAYAAGGGGLYRSTDGGRTWRLLFDPTAFEFQRIALDPTDTSVIMTGGGGPEVYLSTDGGTSFTRLPDATGDSQYRGMAIRGQTIYLGGNSFGIAVSTDRGATFNVRSTGLPMRDASYYESISGIHIDPRDANVAYAEVYAGVPHRTLDGGLTWQAIAPGVTGDFNLRFGMSLAQPDRLYSPASQSTDQGTTWTPFPGPAYGHGGALSVHPTDPEQLFLGANDAVVSSSDGGNSWQYSRVPRAATIYATSATGSPTKVLAAHNKGASLSTDGGVAWTTSTGLKGGRPVAVARDPRDSDRWFVAYEALGLHRTEDGGRTWTELNEAIYGEEGARYLAITDVSLDPQDPDVVYVSAGDELHRSEDGGSTWTELSNTPADAYIYAVEAAGMDSSLLFMAAGTGGVGRSVDRGASWTASTVGLGTAFITSVHPHPTRPELVFALSGSGGFRSLDGGLTWTPLALVGGNGYVSSLRFEGEEILIFTNHFQRPVQRSLDSGLTWSTDSRFVGLTVNDLARHPTLPGVLLVADNDGVLRSADDGTTWRQITDGLSGTYNPSNFAWFDAEDPTRMIASFAYKGLNELQRHIDTGVSLTSPDLTVVAGQDFQVTLRARNDSTRTAQGLRQVLTLPTGVSLIRVSSSAFTCTGSSTVQCSLGVLAAQGNSTTVLTLRASTPGAINLQAALSTLDIDPEGSDDQATLGLTVVGQADLGITLSGPAGTPLTGATASFAATISNAGPFTATAPSLAVALPSGARLVSGDGATCVAAGAGLTCSTADLAAGASRSISLDLAFDTPGSNPVSATVSSLEDDPDSSDDSATLVMTVRGRADLRMRFSTPSPAEITIGQRTTYDSVITNLGPDPATGVAINYVLPSGASSVSASGANCQTSGVTVGCTVATLGNGDSVVIPVAMNLSTTGTMTLSGSASASESDPDTGNNADSSSVGVSRPTTGADLTVAVTGGAASIQVNKTTTYSFSVTNTGPQAITGGTFSFTLPASLLTGSSIKADKPVKCTKGAVMRCTLSAMSVGQTVRGTIKVKAKKVPGTATLTATVSGSSPADFDTSNNSVTRTLTITPKR